MINISKTAGCSTVKCGFGIAYTSTHISYSMANIFIGKIG